jgi:Xaa-Pro aminopeptidase
MVQEQRRAGFTLQERDRRWARLRELMDQQGVDLLVVLPDRALPGDIRFVAGRLGAVVFPGDGEPTFISPAGLHAPTHPWFQDVRKATETGTTAVQYGVAVARRLRELNVGRKRVAIAGLSGGGYTLVRNPEGYASHTAVLRVREAIPDATLVDGAPLVGEVRYVKSEEEIAVLRRSVEIAEASVDALVAHARPGISAAALYAEMVAEQLRRGVESAHVAWGGGPWGEPKQRVVGSPPGVVETGWVLKNEIEPNVQGYTSQIGQPVFVGAAPAEATALFELGQAAFARACEAMRPGATWREVHEQTYAVAHGSPYRIEFLLHGRGLGDEGPLFIPTDDHAEHPLWNDPLRENTAFVLKPYAYRPEGGRDDWTTPWNVAWGDSVVVRAHGAERLGTRPYSLICVP